VLFDELGAYVNRSGLLLLECTGASAATRLPIFLHPDANATLIEENDIVRGDPYAFASSMTGHPLAQTWGSPASSRGTLMGWDDGNVFAPGVLRLAAVREPSPSDGQGEYWGWPAGGGPDFRGESPDIVAAGGEEDPVLLLDASGRGGAVALGGHAQGRNLPYGPMTSTTGPRVTLQSLLLASAWPRLRHVVFPGTAQPGEVVAARVNLTFESGFALRAVNVTERLEPGVLLVPGSLRAGWRGTAMYDPSSDEISVAYSYLDPRRTPVFASFDVQFTATGKEQVLMTTVASFDDVWSPHSVDRSRCARVNPTMAPGSGDSPGADGAVGSPGPLPRFGAAREDGVAAWTRGAGGPTVPATRREGGK
jgi:hypothetical protein